MELAAVILSGIAVILLLILLLKPSKTKLSSEDMRIISNSVSEQGRTTISAIQSGINGMSGSIMETQRQLGEMQDKRLNDFSTRISQMTVENKESLEKIRGTVEEKLQKTLDERISRSFYADSCGGGWRFEKDAFQCQDTRDYR